MYSQSPEKIARRTVLQRGAALVVGAAAVAAGLTAGRGTANAAAPSDAAPPWPIPVPQQVSVTEDFVQAPDARLWYWDTGGTGTPMVLLHPASGSAESWPYQQPFFARAGYRVIGYSRRGHLNSEAGP